MSKEDFFRHAFLAMVGASVLFAGIGFAVHDEPTYVGCAQGDMHCEIEEQYVEHKNEDTNSLYTIAGLLFVGSLVPMILSKPNQ
jgi:hypothetical protein